MAISLATVGGKITAAMFNLLAAAANSQGQTQVVPTSSGTGVTVSALGTVTLLNVANTVALDGIFSALYDEYLIEFDVTSATSTQVTWQLRSSGTADTANDYAVQALLASGSSPSAVMVAARGSSLVGASARETSATIKLSDPFQTAPTRAVSDYISYDTTPAITVGKYAVRHSQSTSYDGISFTTVVSGAQMNGKIRVFGINNG